MKTKTLLLFMILLLALSVYADRKLDNLIKNQKYQKAYDYVEKNFPVENRDITMWHKTGTILEKLGKSENALSCYITIISKAPQHEETLWSLIRLYNNMEYHFNAYTMVKKLIAIKEKSPELLLTASKICSNLERYDEAEGYLLQIYQFNTEAKKLLADIYYSRGLHDKSIPLYKTCFSEMKNLEIAKRIVEYYKEKENIAEALEYFQYVADNDENDHSAQLSLAKYWVKVFEDTKATKNESAKEISYESDSAVQLYKNAISHHEVDINVYTNLGDTYAETGNYDKAITSYREAMKLNTRSTSTFKKLAQCQVKANHINDAIISYEQIIAGWNTETETFRILGDLYKSNGKIPEAVFYYKIFLKSCQDNRLATYVAMYENINENHQTALAYFDRITFFPSDVLYAMGYSYLCLQKYEECIEILTDYTAKYPEAKEYYLANKLLGMAYEIQNNHKAVDCYLIYLSKHDDSDIAFRVGEFLEKTDKKSALQLYKKNSEMYPNDHRNFVKIGELIKKSAMDEGFVKYP